MNKDIFITLYTRDLKKLRAEVEQYTSESSMWLTLPGTINSGGNLSQHLIGNLRTYVGLGLGGFPYLRNRDAEFNDRVFDKLGLLRELDILLEIVKQTLEGLDEQKLQAEYPRDVLDMFPEQNVALVLTHLLAHLSYHTGQINYHRRWVSTFNNHQ